MRLIEESGDQITHGAGRMRSRRITKLIEPSRAEVRPETVDGPGRVGPEGWRSVPELGLEKMTRRVVQAARVDLAGWREWARQ